MDIARLFEMGVVSIRTLPFRVVADLHLLPLWGLKPPRVGSQQSVSALDFFVRKLNIIRAPTRRIINKNKFLLRGNRVQLKPFLLDAWLDQYEHGIEFNLAASTGPTWTVNDILALADDETRHRS
jgi:hypothetical protein